MNWIVDNVTRLANDKTYLAGQQASFIKWGSPNIMWESANLKLSYIPTNNAVYIMLDPWYFVIDGENNRLTLNRYCHGNACAAWDIDLASGKWANVEIASELSSVTISVNEQSFTHYSSEEIAMTSAQVHFPEGTRLLEPQLSVTERVAKNIVCPSTPKRKTLEMTVDFFDDLQISAFNREMLDEMFHIMARYHVSQAYWIHHGKRGCGGIWENNAASGNMQRSFDMLGDDFLPAAVQAAHKANIPLIGVFKPFENMCNYTFPVRCGENGADALGGKLDNIYAFPSQHPALCQRRRKPSLSQSSPAQIVITSRKVFPYDAAQKIQLYVSCDNATYSQYKDRCSIEITEHEIRLSDLNIEEEFVILVFAPELAMQVQNTLPLLAKAYDAKGNGLEFTYGIMPRRERKAEYHLEQKAQLLDFRTHGINFDCAGAGVPSSNLNPEKIRFDLFSPQQSQGWLGLAFTVNAQAPGVLSEAEPEAQQWWLAQIEEMLDAGVDGVDIRMMNHANVIDWQQYGFNQPVVDEYQKRHGVDITSQKYFPPELRRLRGNFFTEFLRRASSMVRGHGKKFYLHIEDVRQGTASEPCPMETEIQWRRWIEEKICDGVTLKALNAWTHDTAFGREVITACHNRNIPVSFAPFIHSAFTGQYHQEFLDSYLTGSHDAFNVYEFATLFAFTEAGKIKPVNEAMINWLCSYKWKVSSP